MEDDSDTKVPPYLTPFFKEVGFLILKK